MPDYLLIQLLAGTDENFVEDIAAVLDFCRTGFALPLEWPAPARL